MGQNGATCAPYPFAYRKGAPYCGESLERTLESIIKRFSPSAVIYPDSHDDHHDHRATNAFIQYALARTGFRAHEYTYLIHRRGYPLPRAEAYYASLKPPPPLVHASTHWIMVPLTGTEENLKARALKAYRIPARLQDPFIESFVRQNELFSSTELGHVFNKGPGSIRLGTEPMPLVVNSDPPSDLLMPGAGQDSDIERVAFGVFPYHTLLGIETHGNVSDRISYIFRLRMFRGSGVTRADIEVVGNKATFLVLAHNSLHPAGGARIYHYSRQIWIKLPSSMFKGDRTVMMSIDSLVDGWRADRISWQRYEL